MKLKDWLRLHKILQKDFAHHIGISESELSRISNMRRIPSVTIAKLIETHSKGGVKASEILQL